MFLDAFTRLYSYINLKSLLIKSDLMSSRVSSYKLMQVHVVGMSMDFR